MPQHVLQAGMRGVWFMEFLWGSKGASVKRAGAAVPSWLSFWLPQPERPKSPQLLRIDPLIADAKSYLNHRRRPYGLHGRDGPPQRKQ